MSATPDFPVIHPFIVSDQVLKQLAQGDWQPQAKAFWTAVQRLCASGLTLDNDKIKRLTGHSQLFELRLGGSSSPYRAIMVPRGNGVEIAQLCLTSAAGGRTNFDVAVDAVLQRAPSPQPPVTGADIARGLGQVVAAPEGEVFVVPPTRRGPMVVAMFAGYKGPWKLIAAKVASVVLAPHMKPSELVSTIDRHTWEAADQGFRTASTHEQQGRWKALLHPRVRRKMVQQCVEISVPEERHDEIGEAMDVYYSQLLSRGRRLSRTAPSPASDPSVV